MFVDKGETSRSHEIDEKGFHEKLCASDGSGQPEITFNVIEGRNLSENTRVEQTHRWIRANLIFVTAQVHTQ